MTFSAAARRRLAVPLLSLLAAASACIAAPPALAIGNDPNCDPGNDCTGFEHAEYEVTEGAKHVEVTVFAAWCCPAGQGQIDYETRNGSAIAGQDFQHTSGTLTYAGGGWGAFYVPINDDTLSEGSEQFEVRLTNFRGTFVDRGRETAIVTILDKPENQVWTGSASPEPLKPDRGSQPGSSASPPPPSGARVASGSGAARPQPQPSTPPAPPTSVLVGATDPLQATGEVATVESSPVTDPYGADATAAASGTEDRGDNRRPFALFAGLASLVLATVAAARFRSANP